MTIRELCNLSLNREKVILCDCTNTPTNTYEGLTSKLIRDKKYDAIIDNEISSWNIEDNKICLNYIEEGY